MPQLSYLKETPATYSTRLDGLPASQRPQRRVAETAAACNLIELLAALIGGPRQIETAEALISHFGSLRRIFQASTSELSNCVAGIGPAVASRLSAAFEIGRRLTLETDEQPIINGPIAATALVQYDMSLLDQEEMWVLLLNTHFRLIEIDKLYKGSVNTAIVRVGEVYKKAIKMNASHILIVHCHPSGDPTPSPDDIALTRAVVQAGKMLDICCLDHLIIGRVGPGHPTGFVSLKERGLSFNDA